MFRLTIKTLGFVLDLVTEIQVSFFADGISINGREYRIYRDNLNIVFIIDEFQISIENSFLVPSIETLSLNDDPVDQATEHFLELYLIQFIAYSAGILGSHLMQAGQEKIDNYISGGGSAKFASDGLPGQLKTTGGGFLVIAALLLIGQFYLSIGQHQTILSSSKDDGYKLDYFNEMIENWGLLFIGEFLLFVGFEKIPLLSLTNRHPLVTTLLVETFGIGNDIQSKSSPKAHGVNVVAGLFGLATFGLSSLLAFQMSNYQIFLDGLFIELLFMLWAGMMLGINKDMRNYI